MPDKAVIPKISPHSPDLVQDGNKLFPIYLYNESSEKKVSGAPCATFDYISAVEHPGNEWNSITPPSKDVTRKTLILDTNSFQELFDIIESNSEKILAATLLTNLHARGFNIIIKTDTGFREVTGDLKTCYEALGKIQDFSQQSDYRSLAKLGIAKDRAVLLEAKHTINIYKRINGLFHSNYPTSLTKLNALNRLNDEKQKEDKINEAGGNTGKTVLLEAIECGEVEIVKVLLENGADVNKADANFCTPLHMAIKRSNLEIVKLLLKYGADTSLLDSDKYNALQLASKSNNFKIVRELLKHGAQVKNIPYGTQSDMQKYLSVYQNELDSVDIGLYSNIERGRPYYKIENSSCLLIPTLDKGFIKEIDKNKGNEAIRAIVIGKVIDPNLLQTLLDTLPNAEIVTVPKSAGIALNNAKIKLVEFADLDSNLQPSKTTNKLFIANNAVGGTFEASDKSSSFNMVDCGEVLNASAANIRLRSAVKQRDLLKGLQELEYIPSGKELQQIKQLISLDANYIDSLRQARQLQDLYLLFAQKLEPGHTNRLLSVSTEDELHGFMAEPKDATLTFFKGDDGCFYVKSNKQCRLTYVVKSPKEPAKLPDDYPGKSVLEKVKISRAPEEGLPPYDIRNPNSWLEAAYNKGVTSCRHKTAVAYHYLIKEAKVVPKDIRIVVIDNNHEILEVRHNGQWYGVDLGGSVGELKYDTKEQYAPKPVTTPVITEPKRFALKNILKSKAVAPPTESITPPSVTKQPNIPGTTRTAKTVPEPEKLADYRITAAKTLIVSNNTQQTAVKLLEDTTKEGREAYYLKSLNQINFNDDTVVINEDDSISVKEGGEFRRFIEKANTNPTQKFRLVINWAEFNSKQRVMLNSIIDEEPSIYGFNIPENMDIVSIYVEKPKDSSIISRHGELKELKEYDNPKSNGTNPPFELDLEGFSDWQQKLMGRMVLTDGKVVWHKSELVKQLEAGTPFNFKIINSGRENYSQLNNFVEEAVAKGYFSYHGRRINIPKGAQFECSESNFDFSKFVPVNICNYTYSSCAPTYQVINSHLFDQLLVRREIKDGMYHEIDGLIKAAAKTETRVLNLYISSALTETQYYCMLNAAKNNGVTLNLALAPNIALPRSIKTRTFKMEQTGQAMAKPVHPNIIISNNTAETTSKLEDAALIIDVEDYGFDALISKTVFTRVGNEFNEFKEIKSEILTRLEKGEKVVLKGKFPPALLEMLHPLILGQQPNFDNTKAANLTLIIEGESSEKENFSFLGKDAVKTEEYKTQVSEAKILFDETKAANDNQSIMNRDTKRESDKFIDNRRDALQKALAENSMVTLSGETGVGKSGLIKSLEHTHRQGQFTVYRELGKFEAWAKDKSPKTKILFIDESNMEDMHLTMFAPLKQGGNKRILYNGQIFELDEHHKVVFARNPKSYSAGRFEQKLFEDNAIPEIKFGNFPDSYIYEKILKKSIYDKTDPKYQTAIGEKAFKAESVKLIEQFHKENITVRELQERALLFILDKVDKREIPKISNPEFASVSQTHAAEKTLHSALRIRELQRKGTLPSQAVGNNAVILKGDSGTGKSKLITAVLKETLTEYYKIDAGMKFKQKQDIICKAFEEGRIVVIDEVNSCIDDGLEKVLNAALTGRHPKTGETSKNPGFMLLSSINDIDLEGRSSLSGAINGRATLVEVRPLKSYSNDDFKVIIKSWDLGLSPASIDKKAQEFFDKVQNQNENSEVNLRSLKAELVRDREKSFTGKIDSTRENTQKSHSIKKL